MKIDSKYSNQWGLPSQKANIPHGSHAVGAVRNQFKIIPFSKDAEFSPARALWSKSLIQQHHYVLCYLLLDKALLPAAKGFSPFTLCHRFTKPWYSHSCQYPRCSITSFMIGFYAPTNRKQTDTQIMHRQCIDNFTRSSFGYGPCSDLLSATQVGQQQIVFAIRKKSSS